MLPTASLLEPFDVLPMNRSFPLCPLDVSRTDSSTVAVFMTFVSAVVAYVCVAVAAELSTAVSEMKTSAKPGAGTWI